MTNNYPSHIQQTNWKILVVIHGYEHVRLQNYYLLVADCLCTESELQRIWACYWRSPMMELERVVLQASGHKDFHLAATAKRVQQFIIAKITMTFQLENKIHSRMLMICKTVLASF